jgi:hypothetical protein
MRSASGAARKRATTATSNTSTSEIGFRSSVLERDVVVLNNGLARVATEVASRCGAASTR